MLRPGRDHKAEGQLHQPGDGGGKGHAHDTHLRRAQPAENEYSVQYHIEPYGDGVEHCAYSHAAYASEYGDVYLRNPPAQVTHAEYPYVPGPKGY